MKNSKRDWEPLKVGQIRKLHPSREIGSSRLVLIADKDKRDGTYLVFLLNNLNILLIIIFLVIHSKSVHIFFLKMILVFYPFLKNQLLIFLL
jgi:hypothetical protein